MSSLSLISDAAHRVHPLAGLGVNLGIGDVIYLHNELLRTSTSGGDWGMIFTLKHTHINPFKAAQIHTYKTAVCKSSAYGNNGMNPYYSFQEI